MRSSRRRTRALSKLGALGLVWASVASLGGCVVGSPPVMRGAVAGNGTATVSWSPPSGAGFAVSGYSVTPYRESGSVAEPAVTFPSSAVRGTITGLTNGASYLFVVQAVDANGVRSAASDPSDPVTPSPAIDVSAGGSHSCALLASGGVQCWGSNTSGQLGNGTTTSSPSPVAVVGITDAVGVSTSASHSCAVLAGGGVQCWGNGLSLGRGVVPSSPLPKAVPGLTDAVSISAKSHTCAVRSGGGVRCWGGNSRGQLGNGNTGTFYTPVNVVGLTDAVAVSAGFQHTCAVRTTGAVQCWGDDEYAQLWSDGITNAVGVSAGEVHSCAVLSDGGASCWGSFQFDLNPPTPLLVYNEQLTELTPLTDAVDVMANATTICGVQSDGDLLCGPSTGPGFALYEPRLATGAAGVSMSPTGDSHLCFVVTGGGLRCRGSNGSGQLGNGTTTSSSAPVAVVGY